MLTDHADIKETIEDAADDWQAKGYTSALAEVRDMAAVGRSLMEALPKGYCYMDSPAEIVSDLQNDLDEARGILLQAGGHWQGIEQSVQLKGLRRSPKYYPAIGETCRMSGPNCDDADGYTWAAVEVLWRDDLFVVTRVPGCWPTVTKLELALFEPAATLARAGDA